MGVAAEIQQQIDEANKIYADAEAEALASESTETASELEIEIPVFGKPSEETVPKKDFDALQQQFKSLQGIHKSLQTERNNAVTAANELFDRVSVLEAERAAVAEAPKLITADEEEQYTPELLDIISRKAEEVIAARLVLLNATITQLENRNRGLEQTLSVVSQETGSMAKDRFYSNIATLMPDFQRVNDDPNFMSWLETPNRLTGKPFAVDFYNAAGAYDAQRVVDFFQEYDKLSGYAQSGDVAPLEEQETPSTRRSARTPTKQGELWTTAKISQFYKDKSEGKYKNNPDRALRLEQDLFKAQNEGRVSA